MPSMVFRGVPIPPSSNNQYVLVRRGRKTFHVPSKELKAFRTAMAVYFAENADALKFAREVFVGHPLTIYSELCFEKSRILTKKGTFKRLDVSNRLKALHDAFAEALLIDDCCFVAVSARKTAVQSVADEQTIVEISLADFEERM